MNKLIFMQGKNVSFGRINTGYLAIQTYLNYKMNCGSFLHDGEE